ncbi:MAG: hypothetical protein JXA52_07055 [Planctomycetes bacterium]|nr:hypothetical protein [Planctomycetota bacterium]
MLAAVTAIPIIGSFPPLPLLFFGVILFFVIIGLIVNFISERKRTEAWQALAEQSGFTFENKNAEIHQAYPFHLLNQGSFRQCRNVLQGTAAGTTVTLADYQYTVSTGRNSTTHKQTICLAQSDRLHLPAFNLRPENFFDRFGEILGGVDYDFEEDAEFSEMYVLQGDDETAVRALFNESARKLFVSAIANGPHVEGGGNAILLHYGKRISPHETAQLMELAFELMKLWAG